MSKEIDILADWKRNRFMIADSNLGISDSLYTVILTDWEYWTSNYQDLYTWCEQYQCRVQGMTVDVPDAETLTLFSLRWV